MAKRVFVTGITGKSGLYLLDEIVKANDDNFSFTFLVRNKEKEDKITKNYPKAKICLGSFDDAALLKNEFQNWGAGYTDSHCRYPILLKTYKACH